MKLAARLLLAFGLLVVLSTASIQLGVRHASRNLGNQLFHAQMDGARKGIQLELAWEQSAARELLRPVCEHAAFVDQTLVDLQAGRLDSGRRLALAQLVPNEMKALQLDELVLLTSAGEILGSGHDAATIGTTDPDLAAQLSAPEASFPPFRPRTVVGKAGRPRPPAIMVRCTKRLGSHQIGLVGARNLAGILDRVGNSYGVRLTIATDPKAAPMPGERVFEVDVGPNQPPGARPTQMRLVAVASTRALEEALARLDHVILVAGGITLIAAILIAVVLARSLASPIAQLASEVREVTEAEPRPVHVRGTFEMRQLAEAFNKTLSDLATLRRRHAAMERIAAWREVARRVAHEIKNPLTPIRSAMETLRRLHDRNDPQFNDYFEQATKGVLDDVHRIATIASDFARFARLPAPKPAPIDLSDTVRNVVAMHSVPDVQMDVVAPQPLVANADKDQIIQVLTNLLQNSMDAVRSTTPSPRIQVLAEPCRGELIRLAVSDNGPGVAADLVAKIFEPYVTTKAHGTGLGLPIVQRIVVEHGGEISYSRGQLGGACFTVLLPKSGPAPTSAPTPELDPTR